MREKQTQGRDPLNIKAICRQRGLKQSDLAAKLGSANKITAAKHTHPRMTHLLSGHFQYTHKHKYKSMKKRYTPASGSTKSTTSHKNSRISSVS
jgi:hypothetical protein